GHRRGRDRPMRTRFHWAALILCAARSAAANQVSFVEPSVLPITLPATGDGTGGIASADFNGDGIVDVALTYGNPDPAYRGVRLNNGDGSFQIPIPTQGPYGGGNNWANG